MIFHATKAATIYYYYTVSQTVTKDVTVSSPAATKNVTAAVITSGVWLDR
jgi:hypothetical protein